MVGDSVFQDGKVFREFHFYQESTSMLEQVEVNMKKAGLLE